MSDRRAWIAGTGDELVEGRLVDGNGAFLARLLTTAGWDVRRLLCVGDRRDDLLQLLRETEGATDLLVITGGLGNTDDDLTRPVLAEACGTSLREDPAAREQVQAFYRRLRRTPRPEPWVEASAPLGATILLNPLGLAPGLEIARGGVTIVALPGVPAEMRAMARARFAADVEPTRLVRGFRLFGMAEADVAARLGDMMRRGRDPLLGIGCKEGWLELVLRTRTDGDAATAAVRLERDVASLRAIFGERLESGDGDDPVEPIARELIAAGETLAVAESLTGGLVSHLLTEVPGVSAVLRGACVAYTSAVKCSLLGVDAALIDRESAVSESVARAMAEGVRHLHDADWGLATTGVAGPGPDDRGNPPGSAYVAVARRDGTTRAEHRVHPGDRGQVKQRAARHVLDLLRRMRRAESGAAATGD